MHAKSQLIWAIPLARAMGVVRNLTSHLIFGGNLYLISQIYSLSSPFFVFWLDSIVFDEFEMTGLSCRPISNAFVRRLVRNRYGPLVNPSVRPPVGLYAHSLTSWSVKLPSPFLMKMISEIEDFISSCLSLTFTLWGQWRLDLVGMQQLIAIYEGILYSLLYWSLIFTKLLRK